MSHPQMLYYLAVTQIEEAHRLADRARDVADAVRQRRARRAAANEASPAPEEVVERVPSLV